MSMEIMLQMRIMLDVAIALVLGGLIGLERESARKPAGFRTHMLVSGAAALLMGLGDPLLSSYSEHVAAEALRADPIRLFEAIVTGIAFLGAGTIIRRHEDGGVEGLTTAGSMLMAGVIGICIAMHLYLLGAGVTLLTLLLLRAMSSIERKFGYKNFPS